MKHADDSRESGARFVDTNERPACRKIACYQQAASVGLGSRRNGFPSSDEGDFRGLSRIQRRDAGDFQFTIAFPSGTETRS
jgi:hypothetical protein